MPDAALLDAKQLLSAAIAPNSAKDAVRLARSLHCPSTDLNAAPKIPCPAHLPAHRPLRILRIQILLRHSCPQILRRV